MADVEENKLLARRFCEYFTNGSWDELADILDEDFRWLAIVSARRQSPVLTQLPPMMGPPGYSKRETLEIFSTTKGNCVNNRFDLTLVALTAEGDRVAFEAEAYAVNKANGRVYDNHYHHLITCSNGRIAGLREYQDTLLVFDVWMAP
jgi:ketosteroid isomerase-like protein